ncbi:MBL fold metallo-hydrolase, partial [Candidatus Roizmanbacteria bacterium]|nr:MBL fold metallo-hydrolase [Candidatus Roizmanbacteria bacterium]
AGEIQKSINIPLHIFNEDQFLIDRVEETAKHFLGYSPGIIKPTSIKHLIEAKNKIGIFEFSILNTPGHTPGSRCFYFKKENIIFSGDTLFKQGIGRYDFSYSSKEDLKKSIRSLLKLPDDTIVYPGHGEKTIIGNEKEFALTFF